MLPASVARPPRSPGNLSDSFKCVRMSGVVLKANKGPGK
jgi:hypothetical protein